MHGGRTVNVRALGEIESEAEAESGLFADGAASIAFSLEFSTADILAQIDGNVQADMNTPGGEVVKFEFDPTFKAAVFTSDDTANRLVGRIQCDTPLYNCDPSTAAGLKLKTREYVRLGDTVR